MSKVTLIGRNDGPIDPLTLLKLAEDWDLSEVVIIGKQKDGVRCWGTSSPEVRDILLTLEWAKFSLMESTYTTEPAE